MTSKVRIPLAVLALVLGLAAGLEAQAADDGFPVPRPPKGQGEQCVAPTEVMRRDHMNLLLHKRDQTMQDGIRTKRFSLKECVACHAVAGADGKPVGYDNPKNFCRQCHDYTAVSIDCFECHASKPDSMKQVLRPADPRRPFRITEFTER